MEFKANQIAQFVIGGPAPPQIDFEIPIPAAGPADVAWGSDGNVWYADFTGKIGRTTPAGVTTPFTIPTASPDPEGMTAGLDGAIWFTEKSSNKIGRVTTSGAFTEYPVPTANSGPNGIGIGPDGAVEVRPECDVVDPHALDEVVDMTDDLRERRVGDLHPVLAQERDGEVDADDAARVADGVELLVAQVP